MKKNELVHLHALLTCVAEDFVERGVVDESAFAAYRELGTTSMALRASRGDHAAAVRLLTDVLSAAAADAGAAGGTSSDADPAADGGSRKSTESGAVTDDDRRLTTR
jgi:hypothetical protein